MTTAPTRAPVRGYDLDALRLLAVSSIRRLWPMRNNHPHAHDARIALHQWVRTIRTMPP